MNTKCNGENCDIRETCYRYFSKYADEYQEWLDPEYDSGIGYCPNYWDVKFEKEPND